MPANDDPNLPARPRSPSEFLLYQTEDGRTRLEVRLAGETVWLSLNQMADLLQRDKSIISKHIRNIFDEGELHPGATVAKFATVQLEGERRLPQDSVVAFFATTARPGLTPSSYPNTPSSYPHTEHRSPNTAFSAYCLPPSPSSLATRHLPLAPFRS